MDSKSKRVVTTVLCRFLEPLDKDPAVRKDNPLRLDIVGIGGDLDVLQPFTSRMRQQQRKSSRSVPAATFPGDDCIADVPEDVRRQL